MVFSGLSPNKRYDIEIVFPSFGGSRVTKARMHALGGILLSNSTTLVSARIFVCGDGYRNAVEACDDGNVAAGDGCSATCRAVEVGYTCTSVQGSADTCILCPSGCACGEASQYCINMATQFYGGYAVETCVECSRMSALPVLSNNTSVLRLSSSPGLASIVNATGFQFPWAALRAL